MEIDGVGITRLNQVMDVLEAQHQTLAQNIANANTAGYTRHQVDFRSALAHVMESHATPAPRAGVRPGWLPLEGAGEVDLSAEPDMTQPARMDGNNVNLEQEMVAAGEINQGYSALAKIAAKSIRAARYVISEGRR